MQQLILSLFPGLDVLGMGFERAGFCVVESGDVIWGRDVRNFSPPAGRFDGVIGGPPCQAFSSFANILRAKGQEPHFTNLVPEFERVVSDAQPKWFLMENVPLAVSPKPQGYMVKSFLLSHHHLDRGDGIGHQQKRQRKFWFGSRYGEHDLRRHIKFADHLAENLEAPVTGRNEGRVGSPTKDYSPPKRSIERMLELQGLPKDFFRHSPLTMQAKRKLVGNAVSMDVAIALGAAVKKAIDAQT